MTQSDKVHDTLIANVMSKDNTPFKNNNKKQNKKQQHKFNLLAQATENQLGLASLRVVQFVNLPFFIHRH